MDETFYALIFYAFIGILCIIFRRKLTTIGKVGIAYKMKPWKWLRRISRSKIFSLIPFISIPVSFFCIWITTEMLCENLFLTFGQKMPGVAPLIPGIKLPGYQFYVPLVEGLIAIFVLAFVHEISHAIYAFRSKIKVKSIGFGLFLIFPIAFVELDERSEAKARLWDKLKVYAAGSFGNLLTWLILFLLLPFISAPLNWMVELKGVEIIGLVPNSPASKLNMSLGLIEEMDGKPVKSLNDFRSILYSKKPGDELSIKVNGTVYNLTLAEKEERRIPYSIFSLFPPKKKPFIGVYLKQRYDVKGNRILFSAYSFFISTLSWIGILNLLVGLFNLLPLRFLDGGKIVYSICEKFKARKVADVISAFTLALIILNLLVPWL